jgi:hypothetical protein
MYSRSAKGGEKADPNRNPWLAKMPTDWFPKLRFILSVLPSTLESKTSKLFDEKVKHGQAPRIYFILFGQRQRPHTAKNNKIK